MPEPAWKGFATGSLGAMVGGASAHPLDLLKVRMQLQGEGSATAPKLKATQMFSQILRTEGPMGFSKGIGACLLRQGVYSGTRFGMYDVLKVQAGEKPGHPLGFLTKCAVAMASGAIGAFVGNPGDVAMVRMQADGKLPISEQRGYKSVVDALTRIAREEGVGALWRSGVVPNMNRAMVVTVGQLAAYDQIKQLLREKLNFADTITTHFQASLGAAFIASALSNPVDVAKTRLMNQKAVDGKLPYSGMMDCMGNTVKNEGVLALYKGVVPALMLVSHGVVQFGVYEFVKANVLHSDGSCNVELPFGAHMPTSLVHFCNGAVSKLAASTLTYPLQVVKTRLQQRHVEGALSTTRKYSGMVDCVRGILHEEGYRGFFKGCVPNALRVVPAAAVTFLVYEEMVQLTRKQPLQTYLRLTYS